MKKIGFIDAGIMGKSMARNLMKVGYEVAIYTRTRSKVEDITGEGTIWCGSAGECTKRRQVVISIVGYPEDVEDIYFGEGGTITNADPGTYLVDMTIISLKLTVRICKEAKKAGLHILDTPVVGDDKEAKDEALAILTGGDREDFDAYLNALQATGKSIDYEGKAGNGQHTKMCSRIAVAGVLAGAYEAMAYAKNVGLDADTMLKSISAEAASSMQINNVASRALQDGYRPGLFIKHSIKDMSLADEEARATDTESKALEGILPIYKELEQEGIGELGMWVLIKYHSW